MEINFSTGSFFVLNCAPIATARYPFSISPIFSSAILLSSLIKKRLGWLSFLMFNLDTAEKYRSTTCSFLGNKLYLNRVAIGGFMSNGLYWSSSEIQVYPYHSAWLQDFGNGGPLSSYKDFDVNVRAIRSF